MGNSDLSFRKYVFLIWVHCGNCSRFGGKRSYSLWQCSSVNASSRVFSKSGILLCYQFASFVSGFWWKCPKLSHLILGEEKIRLQISSFSANKFADPPIQKLYSIHIIGPVEILNNFNNTEVNTLILMSVPWNPTC